MVASYASCDEISEREFVELAKLEELLKCPRVQEFIREAEAMHILEQQKAAKSGMQS